MYSRSSGYVLILTVTAASHLIACFRNVSAWLTGQLSLLVLGRTFQICGLTRLFLTPTENWLIVARTHETEGGYSPVFDFMPLSIS